MRLILSSAGFQTKEIAEHCERLVGKPSTSINFAVINEAYAVEHGDHSWMLEDLNNIKKYFSGTFEVVNLLALPISLVKERIMLADVIFVVGGHTDYLMSVFNATGFTELLQELLKSKVYVGSSAGAMVMGKRVSNSAYKIIYRDDSQYKILEYLNLVDFSIMPHLDSPCFANRQDALIEVSKDSNNDIYGIKDDTAIIIEGANITVVGSQALIYSRGNR